MTNLRQAAQDVLELVEWIKDNLDVVRAGGDMGISPILTDKLRAALAEHDRLEGIETIEKAAGIHVSQQTEPEQEMTKQKPVAWTDGRGFIASHADSFPRGTTVSPLYAHPPTPRKPLTDEEIIEHFEAEVGTGLLSSFADGVRFAERAHGITGETNE